MQIANRLQDAVALLHQERWEEPAGLLAELPQGDALPRGYTVRHLVGA